MDWTNILRSIDEGGSYKLVCLHGSRSLEPAEFRELSDAFKKSHAIRKRANSIEVSIVTSRSRYISQHQHEGLFFQQRYQASYNDQGETVGQRLANASRSGDPLRLQKMIEEFELESLMDKPLLQLSSGEWQRYAVCEALMTNPALIIMPDLLKGLDHNWQQKILTVVEDKLEKGSLGLFTSDVPARLPGVFNIAINSQQTPHETIPLPSVPEALVTRFQEYQSRYLPGSSDEVVLRMSGVNIRYGDRKILRDIDWTVHAGDKWNIQGPNGAGKSTIISLVNSDNPQGYSQPIEMFGSKYGRYSIWDRKARISYFGSDFFQYFRSSGSIGQVLNHQLKTPYLDTLRPAEELIHDLLGYFGLDKHREQPYLMASHEIKRQILLVAAYLKSSDVLILDEPYQDLGLDTIRRHNQFLETIQPFSAQTVIFVTHREDHKPGFLNKILVLENGQICF